MNRNHRYFVFVFYLGVFFFSHVGIASGYNFKTIYGEDSREEISRVKKLKVRAWENQIFALVDRTDLIEDRHGVRGKIKTLGQEYSLCKSERFYYQPTLSFCTGFQIDRQWIVTAKHCVEKMSCEQFRLLQGYKIEKQPDFKFSYEEQLKCSEIIESYDEDLAFLHLDSPREMEVSSSDFVSPMTFGRAPQEVQMIGFPLGLPMKWSEGKMLAKKKGHIYAALDSFEGNSGSPILNSDQKLVGVLLGGDEDFESRQGSECKQSYRCEAGEQCEGEEILSIDIIQDEFDRLIR